LIGRTINEWWIGKAVKGSSHCPFQGTVPEFAWGDWREP
jgi:hypothetical protein